MPETQFAVRPQPHLGGIQIYHKEMEEYENMRYCTVKISHGNPEQATVTKGSYHELNEALRWMDNEFLKEKPKCTMSSPLAMDQEMLEKGIPTLVAYAGDSEKSCFILRATETGNSVATFTPFGYEITHPLRYCLEEAGRIPITEAFDIQRTPLSIRIML